MKDVSRSRDGQVSAADFLPARRTLPALREAAAGCRGCPLWERGTQTVFGEGPTDAQVASAPTFRSLTRRGRELVLSFDTSSPLVVHGTKLGGFAVAGADRRFVWANARLEGSKVVVSNESVADPVAVRYAWSDNPADANLFATNGLPVTPFRSDSW